MPRRKARKPKSPAQIAAARANIKKAQAARSARAKNKTNVKADIGPAKKLNLHAENMKAKAAQERNRQAAMAKSQRNTADLRKALTGTKGTGSKTGSDMKKKIETHAPASKKPRYEKVWNGQWRDTSKAKGYGFVGPFAKGYDPNVGL